MFTNNQPSIKDASFDQLELRSRNSKFAAPSVSATNDEYNFCSPNNGRVTVDYVLKAGDTLNSIALQYSVPVSYSYASVEYVYLRLRT